MCSTLALLLTVARFKLCQHVENDLINAKKKEHGSLNQPLPVIEKMVNSTMGRKCKVSEIKLNIFWNALNL